jgi:hypothetical protein
MKIRACIRCGSLELDFTPGDGSAVLTRIGVGPVGGVALCKDCGYLGGHIEFDSERDYMEFVRHLKKPKEGYKNNE